MLQGHVVHNQRMSCGPEKRPKLAPKCRHAGETAHTNRRNAMKSCKNVFHFIYEAVSLKNFRLDAASARVPSQNGKQKSTSRRREHGKAYDFFQPSKLRRMTRYVNNKKLHAVDHRLAFYESVQAKSRLHAESTGRGIKIMYICLTLHF